MLMSEVPFYFSLKLKTPYFFPFLLRLHVLLLLTSFVALVSVAGLISCFSNMKQRRGKRRHTGQDDKYQSEETALLDARGETTYGSSSTA